ncbi:uncharacterized protein OCT59_008968 [Rhizophagus irregularis]|uniref:uncharacterized protein n=1 Tax=Rhizophagus irregularis TaxID=588596 RepID=UPI003331FCFF|nr:hypothetical protein OCT59_008968 [Rhizophagus irregularis]
MQQTIVRIETKSNIYTLEIRNQNLQISWYRISSLKSVSDTVSYHVSQKITVPPIPPILAVQINGMGIAAKIRINGKADRIADVEINALGCYLRKENYESKSILVEWYFRSRRLWI